MPRKLPSRVRGAPRKTRKYGSSDLYRASEPFLQNPPVKRYQESEVVIDDIGIKGDGIAMMQGYRIFVPGAEVGRRIKIRIVSAGSRFAVAERTTKTNLQINGS
jgi:23S rRNA (uridine2552-2'-O)-methyltransferase